MKNIEKPINYKSELCRYYLSSKGCDKNNEECNYAHGEDELRCKYYINGFCKNGDNCDFIHIKENNNYKVENIKINKKDISSKEENEHNNIFEDEKNEKNFDDIEKLILDFEDIFEKYVKEIKINIDKEFTEDKLKYGIGMKLELNKINSEISLFKHNLKDFIKYNN